MKILLDTHTFLWFIAGDAELDRYARQLIEEPDNERYLSVASVWEITIKSSLGRLTVPTPPSALLREHVWANAINLLAITSEHFDELHHLPYRAKTKSVSISAELAARAAFLAQLHRKSSMEEWLAHIIEERVALEEAVYSGVKQELATKSTASPGAP